MHSKYCLVAKISKQVFFTCMRQPNIFQETVHIILDTHKLLLLLTYLITWIHISCYLRWLEPELQEAFLLEGLYITTVLYCKTLQLLYGKVIKQFDCISV